MRKENLKILLRRFGTLYSKELDINLKNKKKEEIFKWFLASILFGARISETIAKNTYKAFEKYNLLTPQKILEAGWNFLVNPIMREGGYVRYDEKTSNKCLKISKALIEKYNNDLNKIEKISKDSKDLEEKIQEFYGVGPTTTRIFLRELRGIWKKADPDIGKFTKLAARKLKLPKTLSGLKKYWQKHKIKNYDFLNFEVALLRIGKNFYHKKKKPNL